MQSVFLLPPQPGDQTPDTVVNAAALPNFGAGAPLGSGRAIADHCFGNSAAGFDRSGGHICANCVWSSQRVAQETRERRRAERSANYQQSCALHRHAKRVFQSTRPSLRRRRATCIIYRTAVYGPVRTVVWEERSREVPPIPIGGAPSWD
jgi:hypothetical protein